MSVDKGEYQYVLTNAMQLWKHADLILEIFRKGNNETIKKNDKILDTVQKGGGRVGTTVKVLAKKSMDMYRQT